MPDEMRAALRRVERIRALRATKPISGTYVSRPEMLTILRKHAAAEIPSDALVHEEMILKLLGAIPTTYAFVEKQFELLGRKIAGLYEPSDGTMFLVSDLDPKEAEVTLLHELAHALQDEHYGLRDRIRYRKGKTDALTAASALAEGDATYVMMAAIAGKPAVAPAEFRDAVTSGAKGGNVPDFLSSSLVSSYVDGYEFVYALVRNGGMDALGLAWARPPVTSEQILHPAKWRSGEKAIVIGPPPMPHTVDDDSLGELGLRTYLELGGNRHDAALAAGGWGGDRGSLSIDGEVVQFAWHYRADADAQGAAERVMAELAAVFRNLGTADSTGEGLCVTRADAGPLAAVKRGADIWLVAGPASSRTWRSQATCADARATVARVISAGAP